MYSVPTLRELVENGQADMEAELGCPLPQFGVEQALNVAVSAGVRDLYDYQSWIVRQIIPTSDSEDQTIIDIASSEGVIRKTATKARGKAEFTATVTLPVGAEIKSKQGQVYRVESCSVPADHKIVVNITAVETGYAGNLAEDEPIILVSSVAGVQARGKSLGVTGGLDIEPINQLLERLLYRKRNPPQGGAEHDYVAWCREVGGVSRAWSKGGYRGGSTVGIAFVFDGRDDILPTPADMKAMLAYIYRHQDPATRVYVGRPAGIEIIPIPLTLKTTNLTIALTPDTLENRKRVIGNLKSLERSLSPGEKLYKNAVGTAIGSITSVHNYLCDLAQDVSAADNEIHAIGEIKWG